MQCSRYLSAGEKNVFPNRHQSVVQVHAQHGLQACLKDLAKATLTF